VRDARFVGLSADGRALIVEHDGEHLRLPVDDDVRAALRGQVQMPMPLETRVTPRELQHRIRRGESASQIAAAAGVAVELIARFEGPVLDERRWHVERAQRTVVDGTSLAERFASATTRPGEEPDEATWDAWLADDGGWRIGAELPDGRRAVWAWDPKTRRLRARDDLARLTLSGDIAANDLEAVLRPIAAARQARRMAAVPDEPTATVEPDYDEAPLPDATTVDTADHKAEEALAVEPRDEPTPEPVAAPAASLEKADRTRPSAGKRRAQVPSWDDIVFGTSRRPAQPGDD
jgi:hypothetical protein